MEKPLNLVWFRQDLRINDNPALTAAAEGEIVPVFILDTSVESRTRGEASQWWLYHSLSRLNDSLQGTLRFFIGDPKKILPLLAKQLNVNKVFWNRCYDPESIARDKELKHLLDSQQTDVESFNASLLWEPWQVKKKDDTAYKVFTPFYKAASQISPRFPFPTPELNLYNKPVEGSVELAKLNLLPSIYWYSGIEQQWQPGEKGASKRLSTFLRSTLKNYKHNRDIPSVEGTSKLSPHIHFGEISPNQIWYAAIHAGEQYEIDLQHFLSELGWREFSYYLLFHFPTLPQKNFQTKFDNFPWQKNETLVKLWQQGKTGIPIVDAGMRELWQTGYMHNRVRMIVASFLVKNLMIDWREGEKWFWDCLVDADLASNTSSWQWVAGSGADAAPYFRIFNPVTQGERFDPEGEYVRQYCPELSGLPKKYIHSPWKAPEEILEAAGISLGSDYPKPLVDLKISREQALSAFKQL